MLKLGFIGTGRIAQAHLKAAANLAQDVQVVSIAGRNRERAEKVAGQYGIPKVAGGYRQLLGDPNVDAVVITTPNDSHAEITCAAAQAGKHVLVEKPMALDTASATRMVQAADAAGTVLMVAQSRRFSDAAQTLVRRLSEIGDVFRIHIIFLVPFPAPPTDWWRSAEQAGGLVMLLQGSHSLDSIFWWLGRLPSQIFATATRRNAAWEGEDEADILCTFPGATASVHLSLSTTPVFHESLVVGTQGHFRMIEQPAGPPFESVSRLELNGKPILEGLQTPSAYTHQLREFANAIREKRMPLASGREILSVMRMLDAARQSARIGAPVSVS